MVAIAGKVAVINKRRAGECTTGTIGIRTSHRSLPLFIPRRCDRAVSGICHPPRVATDPTRLTSRKLELHPPIEHRQPACAGGAGNGAQEVAKESHMRRLECTGSRAAGLVGGQSTISRLNSGQFRSSYKSDGSSHSLVNVPTKRRRRSLTKFPRVP